VTPRLLSEQKNGVFDFDVMMAPTSNAVNNLSPAGAFQPLRPFVVLPAALDDAKWHGGFDVWAEKDDRFTLVTAMTAERATLVNRRIVPRNDLSSLDDLLNPKVRGRIAIYNPRAPNNGSLQLAAMLKEKDESFVRQVLQNGVYLDSAAQLAEFANSGRYPIGIGTDPEVLEKLQGEGLAKDVEMTDLAFHAAATGISVLKNAPHPNAAKLLVNWFLSQEGQEAYAREGQTVSRRVDVAPQVAEGMARGAPDWNNLDRYARTNEWQGLPLVDRVTDLAKEVRP
jgi:iron(III) transport system substrate-binding protein